jgi:hypothetical protein
MFHPIFPLIIFMIIIVYQSSHVKKRGPPVFLGDMPIPFIGCVSYLRLTAKAMRPLKILAFSMPGDTAIESFGPVRLGFGFAVP